MSFVRPQRSTDDRIVELLADAERDFVNSLKPTGESGLSLGGLGALPGATSNPRQSDVNFLPTAGGVMIGAIAFDPQTIIIQNDQIDIGKNTSKFKSHLIIFPESGTTDNLKDILNAAHAGQRLTLQGIVGNTITILATGNIRTPNGANFNLTGKNSVDLFFDAIDNKWAFVDSAYFDNIIAASGDNLGNHTATQTLNMNGNSISNLNDILFAGSGQGILSDSSNLQILAGLNQFIRFFINGVEKLAIGTTQIDMLATQFDMNAKEIVELRKLSFIDGHSIEKTSVGLIYTVLSATGNTHRFNVNSTTKLEIDSSRVNVFQQLDMNNNDIGEISTARWITGGGAALGSIGNLDPELAYQASLGKRHSFYVNTAKYFDVMFDNSAKVLKMDSTALIDFNNTSNSASAGTRTLPSNPLGFITARVGGINVKIPYYLP